MSTFFNVKLEFDREVVNQTIQSTIETGGKGYVCAIESNNLAIANKNTDFNNVVNGALINICDGSNVAWVLSKIYKKNFRSFTGSDLFMHYVNMGCYKQYFLGNTREILEALRENLSKIDSKISEMAFDELPFRAVDEFDYKSIAQTINNDKPDIVWVSLGAPKQEEFMSLLLPHLNRGVLFGVGAAFNFKANIGRVKRAPEWMRKLRLEWLYRAFNEPGKNIPRYWGFIKILPKLMRLELKKRATNPL